MAKKILNVATFGLSGLLLGSGKKKAAAPEAPAAPTVMPLPDDLAVQRARRRNIAAQMGRRGRASTILTPSPGSTLGG